MLHLLETFCAVADTGSLSKAAEALHLTQPAVTRQIKALEQDLGAVLLTRTAHGVELTPAGRAVLAHARHALVAVEGCRRAAAEATGGASQLRVAAGHMIMQHLLPPVLAKYRAEYPDVQVKLYTGHYQDCLDQLTGYQSDLALISTPVSGSGLKGVPLLVDPVVAATAPGVALTAGGREIVLAELAGYPILMLPRQSGFHQQASHVLAEAGVDCPVAEHPTVEAVKTMASLNMGVALLPLSAVADEVERGRLAAATISDWPDHGRTVLAVTRSEGAVPLPVQSLLKALRAHYKSK
ncbi:MAG TPA: LysR family transcriptional regulator [Symbiobacteriaceae bacterium]|nr:LysR family transcriptional regulator [Symbiobacteriaceae bacterium]